ncbi:hypothetical protein EV673_2416 [Limnobacter thiooxidans]|uniref:DUF1365 domain-containing protein n=1 Tax=Limnobacter thiooxidans TaxID=131080 RepID=A0AA86J1X6_9BURK|nr:hypothetical protein EV673_2416 [Limnobacter thiooxidans]BET26918.1 DUF1365 domain-containing protein [Limnobacter thiooxidans]
MAQPRFQLNEVKMAWGQVLHHRELPKPNGFRTGACFVRLVFSETEGKTRHRYPVIDGKGIVSVSATNYGLEPHDLKFPDFVAQLNARMEAETGETLNGPVHLHTFPKVLGYVFNPVSFWYFHNDKQRCRVILCEVNNTFGERHFYLLNAPDTEAALNRGMLLHATKEFHVSPFFPVSGRYEFRFVSSENHSLARINYFEGAAQQLSTSVSGKLVHPTTPLWGKTLLKYGWFTLAVVLKIHWQAVKLLFKGAKFHGKPNPPSNTITSTKFEA